jgi:hypothetical protein
VHEDALGLDSLLVITASSSALPWSLYNEKPKLAWWDEANATWRRDGIDEVEYDAGECEENAYRVALID